VVGIMRNDVLRAQAETIARLLLTCYQDEHPGWENDCTPIDELVAWLGFNVATFHPDDQPAGTFGFVDDDGDPIWLCRDLAETLRRFTLAHELGHAALHNDAATQPAPLRRLLDTFNQARHPDVGDDGDRCQQSDIQEGFSNSSGEDALQEQLGVGMTYDPRGERELIANIFAAELLMPIERVRALYLDQSVAPDTLAARFNVSHTALLNRLAGLAEDMLAPHDATEENDRPPVVEPLKPATKTYDAYQQAAIEAPTPTLIVAGPGSGKTSTLIGRVEYLIRQMDVAPEQILALTFSRKAAEEMQERLDRLLGNDEETSGDLPTVSTFHAFCAETLRNYGERVGLRKDFTLVDEVEGYFLLRGQARQLRLMQYRDLVAPDSHFPAFLRAISRAKDELVTPEQYRELAQRMLNSAHDEEAEEAARKALEVGDVYAIYEEGLRQRQDTDFGGLIMLTVRLLEHFPDVLAELQEKYQHVLVDEFQDMNRASGILLRLLAGEARRVWVVGDANQAIYRFRGASPANITRFEQDYPGAVVLPLSRNYRSLPDIVRIAETFRVRQLEFGDEGAPDKNQPARLTLPGASVTLAVAPDNTAEMTGLTADIQARHDRGFAYRDMAVLCRTRAQARKVVDALMAAALPVQAGTGHSLFGKEHVKDALAIVSLLAAPNGMGILRAAHQPDHAFTTSDLETLLLAARRPPNDAETANDDGPRPSRSIGALLTRGEAPPGMSEQGQRSFTRLSEIIQVLSVTDTSIWSLLAHYLFIQTATIRDAMTDRYGGAIELAGGKINCASSNELSEDRLSDYFTLLNLARKYDQQQQSSRDQQQREAEARGQTMSVEPPKLHEQAAGFLDYLRVLLSLGQDGSQRGQNDEEQADGIRIITVHASKGLEFSVVYLPNLRHNSFPTINRKSPMPPPAGMIAVEQDSATGHISGEACLFYVGVTRARDQLVLSYSERNGKQKARASEFLAALLDGQPGEHVARAEWRGGDEARMLQDESEDEESDDLIANDHAASFQPGEEFFNAVLSPTLHASALETYLRCPRQYFYGNICGFHGAGRAYQLFWHVTQQTLETLKERVSEAGGVSAEEAKSLYSQYWQQAEGDALPFAALYEQQGHEIAARLREKLLAGGDMHWELRPAMTVEIAGRTIQLSIDRVEQPRSGGQPARFVRARAAGKRKEKPTPGPREYLYAQAYKQHHNAQTLELYVHNLSTGETMPITFTPKREQKLYEELQESLTSLESRAFPPKPDARMCPTCPFFFICPA
jgi:DNA helicase-2/ATP-dependent DNA helicase PcrA